MSTYHFEFTGRKPSKAAVTKVAQRAIKDGHTQIELSWGENWIKLEKDVYPYARPNSKWFGHGWIKDISGDDLAQELSPKLPKEWGYAIA